MFSKFLASRLWTLGLAFLIPGLAGCWAEESPSILAVDDPAESSFPGPAKKLEELGGVVQQVLVDAGAREGLLGLQRRATNAERKLYLNELIGLEDDAFAEQLRAAIESKGGANRLLSGLPPLELYFPVDEHRTTWSGEADLLVGIQLREDEAPAAFTPDGQRLELSLRQPPASPVLMIVPEEARRGPEDTGGAHFRGPVSESSYPDGLYMRRLSLGDDGEAWPRGDPEIEIHMVSPYSSTSFSTLDTWAVLTKGPRATTAGSI